VLEALRTALRAKSKKPPDPKNEGFTCRSQRERKGGGRSRGADFVM
jgi:hypothetical protein